MTYFEKYSCRTRLVQRKTKHKHKEESISETEFDRKGTKGYQHKARRVENDTSLRPSVVENLILKRCSTFRSSSRPKSHSCISQRREKAQKIHDTDEEIRQENVQFKSCNSAVVATLSTREWSWINHASHGMVSCCVVSINLHNQFPILRRMETGRFEVVLTAVGHVKSGTSMLEIEDCRYPCSKSKYVHTYGICLQVATS
jgi:hypothetical protein